MSVITTTRCRTAYGSTRAASWFTTGGACRAESAAPTASTAAAQPAHTALIARRPPTTTTVACGVSGSQLSAFPSIERRAAPRLDRSVQRAPHQSRAEQQGTEHERHAQVDDETDQHDNDRLADGVVVEHRLDGDDHRGELPQPDHEQQQPAEYRK